MAAPPLGTHRHYARSGAAITADVGHSASLVLFVYILHMAGSKVRRRPTKQSSVSAGGRGAEWGDCREEKRRLHVRYIFTPPALTHTHTHKCNQDTKFQPPLLFLLSRSSSVLPHCDRLLRGAITPTPKIKQKQLAGRLLAVLGFGKKGRCKVRWVGEEAKEGQAGCMK